MQRLTKRELADVKGKQIVLCAHKESDCNDSCMYGRCEWERKALQKLKAYEDAEEQGLLLRLPCKVGDDVYQIPSKVGYELNVLAGLWRNNRVCHQKVARITITDEHWYFECDKDIEYGTDRICLDIFFKKTWFLSEEEAEQALERMEKENG